MKLLNNVFVSLTVALIASWTVSAQPPGKGHGGGKGGHGSGHGGMPDDFRGVIHSLFAEHDKVERTVELTENGYRAMTTSKDPAVATLLRKHVSQMESRFDGGLSVRHWDPAFVELREHYDDLVIQVESLDDGIAVSVVGKTPEAIAVAKNHAGIISGFVEKGDEQMHATHASVVAGTKTDEEDATAAKPGGCGKCQSGKGKGKNAESCGDEKCGKGDKPCCAARAGKAETETKSE